MIGSQEPSVRSAKLLFLSNSELATIHQLNQINFSLTNQAIRAMYLQPYGTADLQISFAMYSPES